MVRVNPHDKTALLRFSVHEAINSIKDRLNIPNDLNEHDQSFFTDKSLRMNLSYLEKVFKNDGRVTVKPMLETSLSTIAKAMNMSTKGMCTSKHDGSCGIS